MMNKFEITMARIEVLAPDENDEQIRITFQIVEELASGPSWLYPAFAFVPV